MANAKSNTVAVETAAVATPAFDIQAYLAAPANKPTGTGIIQGLAYRAGRAADSLAGSADVFDLGRKVGAVAAMKRTDTFRQRAAAEIEALLAS